MDLPSSGHMYLNVYVYEKEKILPQSEMKLTNFLHIEEKRIIGHNQ